MGLVILLILLFFYEFLVLFFYAMCGIGQKNGNALPPAQQGCHRRYH